MRSYEETQTDRLEQAVAEVNALRAKLHALREAIEAHRATQPRLKSVKERDAPLYAVLDNQCPAGGPHTLAHPDYCEECGLSRPWACVECGAVRPEPVTEEGE